MALLCSYAGGMLFATVMTLHLLMKPAAPPVAYGQARPSPPAERYPAVCDSKANRPARPKGSPVRWVTTNDYLPWEGRIPVTGTVHFRLTVGVDGRAASCKITKSSGNGRLDEYTCRLLTRRARFCPATDASAKPITGEWTGRFRWEYPDEPVVPPKP